MTRVELYEVIRRRKLVEGHSIRGIARSLGVHRRMVRQALADARPPDRKRPERECSVLTGELRGVIEAWLVEDLKAPRKQRHTARRVFQRLRDERRYDGSEVTVRRFVRACRRAMGSLQVFVLQHHEPAAEAEIDWGEAVVEFPWGREKAQIFQMRACFSGREFHIAFPRQTQQAFLEAHAAAFDYFGGVFARCRYDNLGAAVRRVLQGRKRIETDRFAAMRSHYLFESEFCLPGLEGAHEKGGVESGVGRFRRSHLVPVPRCAGYDAFNDFLRRCCLEDDQRRLAGRDHTIAEAWAREVPRLRALPAEPFDCAEIVTARVDEKALVTVRTNRYSVPYRWAGHIVEARVGARTVEVCQGGRVIARHPRLWKRFELRIELDHYLELLQRKPGAFAGSVALYQARAQGRWPALYDECWRSLVARYGEQDGTRQLIDVLLLHRDHSADAVTAAITAALQRGGCDFAAIRLLARGREIGVSPPLVDVGALARFDRPCGDVSTYDRLLRVCVPAGIQ